MLKKVNIRKITAFIMAIATFWISSSEFVKITADAVSAAITSNSKNSATYGDINNDDIVDVFDTIYTRKAILNNLYDVDKSIVKEKYAIELQQYILNMSDEFNAENVANGNVSTKTIPDDNEIFSKINTEYSPYKLSVDITAAGWIESNLEVIESVYSYAMSNDCILGYAPQLIYNEKFDVSSVTLKFEIDEDIVGFYNNPPEGYDTYFTMSEEFAGIRRYNIFKYFEEENMLLPILTDYDVKTNTIYATIDEFDEYGIGSYCLMDMEMWLNNLQGAYLDQLEYTNPELTASASASMLSLDEIKTAAYSETELLEPAIISAETFLTGKSSGKKENHIFTPVNATEPSQGKISFSNGKTVEYWTLNGHKYKRFDTADLDADVFKKIGYDSSHMFTNHVAQSYCEKMGGHLMTITSDLEANLALYELMQGRKNTNYYLGAYKNNSNGQWEWVTGESIEYVIKKGFITVNKPETFLNLSYKPDDPFDFKDVGFICEWEPGRAIRNPGLPTTQCPILLPTGDKSVYLDGEPSQSSGYDTDGDGLTDWQEIDTDLIKKVKGSLYDNKGKLNRLTLKDCIDNKSNLKYAKDWIATYETKLKNMQKPFQDDFYMKMLVERYFETLYNITLLPLHSNPADPDSDGDYYGDKYDNDPWTWKKMLIPDSSIDDSGSINGKNPSTIISQNITDGKLSGNVGMSMKNEFTFTRDKSVTRGKSVPECQFSLNPFVNSDYVITVSDVNAKVTVQYDTFGNKSRTVSVAPLKMEKASGNVIYYYALARDKDYTIDVQASVSRYTVKVSQDNWVYAPYGSEQLVYNGVSLYTVRYLTDEAVYRAVYNKLFDKYEIPLKGGSAKAYFGSTDFSDEKFKNLTIIQDYGTDGFVTKTLIEVLGYSKYEQNQILDKWGDRNTRAGLVFLVVDGVVKVVEISTILSGAGAVVAGIGVVTGTIGSGMTLADNLMLNIKNANAAQEKRIGQALYDGKLNISITDYGSGFPIFEPWNRNQVYFNKYPYKFRSIVVPYETEFVEVR